MFSYLLVFVQLLIILCTIGYKKFFYTKHFCILVAYLFLCIALHTFFADINFGGSLFGFYTILVFTFSYIRLKSFLLVSFFYLIQNPLLILVWTLTYDIPNLIWNSTVKNIPLLYIFQILLLSVLIYFLFFLDKRHKLWLQIQKYSRRWTGLDIIILITNIALPVFRQYAILVNNSFSSYIYFCLFLFIFSILIAIISHFVIKTLSDKSFIDQLNNKVQENTEFIILANEFQHDFKTFIYTTKRYSELKDLKGLNSYLNSLETYSTKLLDRSLLDQVYNIKEASIQSLLINCIEQCYLNNIKLSLNIQNYHHQNFFLTIDFARCLSILINNAIESSSGKVYIYFSNFKGTSSCTVRNTSTRPIDIDMVFRRHFSTKNKHQGIGLSIVKNIIEIHPNTDLIVENINNWVSFTIVSTQ